MKVFREIDSREKIEKEIDLNKQLTKIKNSQNYFVKCYGEIYFSYCEDTENNMSDEKIGLLFDKADGTLAKILSKKQNFTFDEIINILKCINDSLLILQQSLKCSHLDIKPGNIVYQKRKDDLPLFKLIDYGETLFIKTIGTLTKGISVTGTQHYFSPEFNYAYFNAIDTNAINTYKSDVYSMAITMMETVLLKKLIFPKNPLGEERIDEKKYDPTTTEIGPYDNIFKTYVEEIKMIYEGHPGNMLFCGLLEEMTKYNFNHRPSLIEIELKIREIIELEKKFLTKKIETINNFNDMDNIDGIKKELDNLYEEKDNLIKNNDHLRSEINLKEDFEQKIKRKYEKIKLENQILLEKIKEMKKNDENLSKEEESKDPFEKHIL